MDIQITSQLRSRQTTPVSKQTVKEKKANSGSERTPNVDTFERSAPKVFGEQMLSGSVDQLHLDGPMPSSGTLAYFDPKEHDGIDWERLEREFFGNREVSIENADSLMGNVDHMVSMYVSVKSTLEQKYADQEDILAEKMERLNALLDKGKRQITSSYGDTVGRFYERMGNKGAASSMSSDLSDAIDRRIAEMEEVSESMESFGEETSYLYKQVVMEVWAFNQREEKKPSKAASEEEEKYSLEDLEAAGMAAKMASNLKTDTLSLLSEEELGNFFTSQSIQLSCLLADRNVGEKMSAMILGSFGTFLNRAFGLHIIDKGL